MKEEAIEKAAELLITMRPNDRHYPSAFQRKEAYKNEIRCHLQVQAALRLAGQLPERQDVQ